MPPLIRFRIFLFNSLLPLFLCLVFIMGFAGCVSKTKESTKIASGNPKDLALQYLSQNQLDEAEAAFQQAIKQDPEDTSSYIGLTRLYLLRQNYDDAEKLDKQGLKLSPQNVEMKLLLAKIYSLKNENENASGLLNEIIQKNPKNAMAYYMLSELDTSFANLASQRNYLLKVQELVPANIVPRIGLTELYAKEGKTDSSLSYLQSVKKIAASFSKAAEIAYDKSALLLQASQPAQAVIYIRQFHELMKISPEYGSGLDEIEIPKMVAGYFDFDTNVKTSAFDTASGGAQSENNSFKVPLTFKLISGIPGSGVKNVSNIESNVLAVADYDAQANMYVYSGFVANGANSSTSSLSVNQSGTFKESAVTGGIEHKGKDVDAIFSDFDNDGYQDLFIATTNGILVFKNKGDGTFEKVTGNIGLNNSNNANKLLFGDFDQDGDLDLLVGTNHGKMLFRNNGDGTFKENAAAMNLAADKNAVLQMDFGDWDNDGDPDIFSLEENGAVHLFNNNRHSNFQDISNSVGLSNPDFKGTAMAIADYNNDGTLDLLIGGEGGKCYLLKNEAGKFVADKQISDQLSNFFQGIKIYDIAFVDYDNDGHKDIAVAGVNTNNAKQGVKLLHNDGSKGFSDASSLLPGDLMQANKIALADFNFDGDRDLFFSTDSGVQLARNDGGNSNNFVQVQLTGLSFGSSKNNRLGIGAQVELKAGDLYQLKTVKGPLTEFGVGSRTKLDALRIIWPNGVPQTIVDPTRKQRALEQAQLKGSCPYLFTWDGNKFVFLKDMLWRSALGMPVAIHGKDTTYAYKEPSKEWLLIPGEKLKPRNGRYTLKVSEELWEAVYFDKAALVAVDHPDSVDTYVDEKFVAPPYPGKKIYQVSHPQLPVSATDDKGNNVLPKLEKL